MFIKVFPRDEAGVILPGQLSAESRRWILGELRSRDIRVTLKMTRLKKADSDEE